nr:M20/M25/M40 family metallo-hydrolase [Acidobacteriota bacterium]
VLERQKLRLAVNRFLAGEKVLATIEASRFNWGVISTTTGGSWKPGEPVGVPAMIMAAEPYNRLVRLVEGGHKVELEVEADTRFYDDDPLAYNTIAEIPGTDPHGEIVMVGAHLDSWHASTGATDNGAGCAVAMEAVRILKALDVKPRRTIRIALWTGEEEALYGSFAYVAQHFASHPEPTDPIDKEIPEYFRGDDQGPLNLKPEYGKLSAYFNLDNGSGRIRGIYTEENAAVGPIFEAWLKPFHDLGATTVSPRREGATDHVPFVRAGLPGFQFIQDQLDYSTETHHTNMDSYDHLVPDDMKQASVVLAGFLYDAAMRPEKLPRKPLPLPRSK